ncbi:MAG TPA: DUF1343 domain-containing protein [Bacteroidales bacterium]|nr:DUF1343 domain-containing protein [Bacteroidales bacterium]HQG36421.1 DUF1343 domain-containing protein [Bacteroidales bacterium]HQG53673.1 DUF1343 domain-containing protein [Bacteroidales bacterium]HQJ20509.1 DUF1343 domain-containing protein [Bacteroidales bacterium]HRC88772.1 DUF1343 domain-containing protein [Bacteroidales bacterium]
MIKTGLQVFLEKFPAEFKGKRAGILCHAPSITPDFNHITDIFGTGNYCRMSAIFGPQHGLFGQTQDNMIEWEGYPHPVYGVPVFSLYGKVRRPEDNMLRLIDFLIADMQDVGARLYTYIWTLKNCMEACAEKNIPVVVLDRPNPIAAIDFDGPLLREDHFTFVGGASIPLCHRMTIGEIALWVKEKYIKKCDLRIIRMEGWKRSMMYNETGLPWVLPSPNMPTLNTAIVYPGMVLFEAMNISEGRGTTIPFELFGAPFIEPYKLLNHLKNKKIPGCTFRIHCFIPAFNKYSGIWCNGLQIHVTDIKKFSPVLTAIEIIDSILKISGRENAQFKNPPYEYEEKLMPFDILAGDPLVREALLKGTSPSVEKERWISQTVGFREEFRDLALYDD